MTNPSRTIKNVIVLGATGHIGVPICEQLLAHPAKFQITAITRNKTNASLLPKDIIVRESDCSASSLAGLFKGQDAVVCALPNAPNLVSQQKMFIDTAIEQGVTRYLPSEYGVDTAHPNILNVLPVSGKKEIVQYLREREAKISWTALCVGSFFDSSLTRPGFMGWDIPNATATIFDGGDVEYEASSLAQIGRAVASILDERHVNSTANQYVYINSFTLTQNKVLQVLEKIRGTKFQVQNKSVSELADEGKRNGAMLDVIVAALYGNGGVNNYSRDPNVTLWNERLGLPVEDLEETIRASLAA